MTDKKLKFKQYLEKFPDCPSADFIEVERAAYRWTNNPLSVNDFIPINLISEPPPRMLDDSDRMCLAYGLSMFDTLLNSLSKYQKEHNKRRPHQREQFKQDKGSHISLIKLTKDDGIADIPNDRNYGHFTFHEHSKTNLQAKILTFYNIVRIGGLSYFEGPLLSLFEELNSGHFYVFDWVDRDHKFNRWIIYRVSPKYLLQFLRGKLSHLKLFANRPNGTVYFTNIDSHNKPFFNYDVFQIENLPDSYIPNDDNFFEQSDCNTFEKIVSIVGNTLSKQKYENEYPKNYLVSLLKHKETKPIYYNKVHSGLRTIRDHNLITRSKSFNLEEVNDLNSNNVEYTKFATYSNSKKPEPIKRREYANQYN
jgi:hypothetical protein